MITESREFDKYVIKLVMFIGGLFGFITGLAYFLLFFPVGVLTGIISGYYLARFYLYKLAEVSDMTNKEIRSRSIRLGILCGIICTTLIHAVMIFTMIIFGFKDIFIFLMEFLVIGEMMGAGVGLYIGGMLSNDYIIMTSENDEAS